YHFLLPSLREASLVLIVIWLGWSLPTHALDMINPAQGEGPLTIIPPADMEEPELEPKDAIVDIQEDSGETNPLAASPDTTEEIQAFTELRQLTLPPGNRINLSRSGIRVPINYRNPRLRSGDTVSISLAPVGSRQTTYVSRPLTVQSSGLLTLTLPVYELAKYNGGSADITIAISRGRNALRFSRPRTVAIVVTSGRDVAARLNARYRNTASSCSYFQRPGYPSYYCNGIIIRSVNNGEFDPWLPSPDAVALQGISFSYFRRDSRVTSFYRSAGFIFFPQREALDQGKAIDFECIYAHDAWTVTGARQQHGCGRRTRALGPNDNSSCDSVGATTYTGWVNFTRGIPHISYQCSLSTQDAAQFALSIAVRNIPASTFPNLQTADWNELIAKIWLNADERLPLTQAQSQTIGTRLPIEAFFYRLGDASSRNDARDFQRKYKQRTNLWLPIVALNLSQVNGSPFSYNDADQSVLR
ncbi:MAG: hypothetical protein ACN6OX_07615, partial [Pseudomonas sp.]